MIARRNTLRTTDLLLHEDHFAQHMNVAVHSLQAVLAPHPVVARPAFADRNSVRVSARQCKFTLTIFFFFSGLCVGVTNYS
jgi:hypothetical protein